LRVLPPRSAVDAEREDLHVEVEAADWAVTSPVSLALKLTEPSLPMLTSENVRLIELLLLSGSLLI
jgi:hypothetical protein